MASLYSEEFEPLRPMGYLLSGFGGRNSLTNWRDTTLWHHIEGAATESTKMTCSCVLDVAEKVLASGGTAPLDFTLHDAEHSFRVAQRMVDLVDPSMLSHSECALLLLSAYVHDIGMSPRRDVFLQHRKFLTTGDASGLEGNQQDELQRWLDENYAGESPPLAELFDDGGIDHRDLILSHYVRHKHNDWSEVWAREHESQFRPGLYANWMDDLVSLCRSHHEGLSELRSARFDAKITGTNGNVVNLRFLAAVLRVADVLEFDPERTPQVILAHRAIVPASKIYWYRDHAISFHIDHERSSMLFSARTPNANIHRAVLEVLSAVNSELWNCAVLAQSGSFKSGSIPEAERERYVWRWPAQLASDIREKDGSFVYIDGTFRPNVERTLRLLSGTALYGDVRAAIRELLQNSVDAVRQQIAYERLLTSDPASEVVAAKYAATHRIRLSLERDDSGYWLRCSDDGVGMSKGTIETHMLVSGAGPTPDAVTLERSAREAGFSVGRTGQFGIGVLSYFMVGSEVEVSTRRSQEAGDVDGQGWLFRTSGISSFGELSPTSRGARGTDVRIRLRDGVLGDTADKIFNSIESCVSEQLRNAPCQIELVSDHDHSRDLVLQAGWTSTDSSRAEAVLQTVTITESGGDFVADSVLEKRQRRAAQLQTSIGLARSKISFFGPLCTHIPEYDADVRVFLPFFKNSRGASLSLLTETKDGIDRVVDLRDVFALGRVVTTSWRGFASSIHLPGLPPCIVEVDFNENLSISVNRASLRGDVTKVGSVVWSLAIELITRFLGENSKSAYALLNAALAKSEYRLPGVDPLPKRLAWKTIKDSKAKWTNVGFPAYATIEPLYSDDRIAAVITPAGTERSVLVDCVSGLIDWITVPSVAGGGTLRFCRDQHRIVPAIEWSDEKEFRSVHSNTKFPPEFREVAMLATPFATFINGDNPIVTASNLDRSSLRTAGHLVEAKGLTLSDAAGAALNWCGRGFAFCQAVKDRTPDVYAAVVKILGRPLNVWVAAKGYDETGVLQLSEAGVSFLQSVSVDATGLQLPDRTRLPLPHDSQWWLTSSSS